MLTRRGLLGILVTLPVAPVLAECMAEAAEDVSPEEKLLALFEEALSKMTPEQAEEAMEKVLAIRVEQATWTTSSGEYINYVER